MRQIRKGILFFFALMVIGMLMSGCTSGEDRSEEKKQSAQFAAIIYEDVLRDLTEQQPEGYPVILTEILKTVPDTSFTKVYVDIWEMNYSFDGVKFKEETGSHIPYRYDINDAGEIIKKWTPRDGSEYADSILEMTEHKKYLADQMLANSEETPDDRKVLTELKRVALERGLKEEEFSFALDQIPGLEKDVVHIREDIPDGFVCVISKKEYDALQKERTDSQETGGQWVCRECLLWDEKTGICVEYLLDYMQ